MTNLFILFYSTLGYDGGNNFVIIFFQDGRHTVGDQRLS